MKTSYILGILFFVIILSIQGASAATCRRWTVQLGNESVIVNASWGIMRRGGLYRDGSFYCLHGCCEYKSNGCCSFGKSRTMIFGSLALGIFLIGGLCLCFVCRTASRRRRQRANGADSSGATADNPPSYDSCVQGGNADENAPSGQTVVTLGVDNLGFEAGQDGSGTLSKPPLYGDIFKEGNTGNKLQVAVIDGDGHVSFVDWKDVIFTRTSGGNVEKITVKSEGVDNAKSEKQSDEKQEIFLTTLDANVPVSSSNNSTAEKMEEDAAPGGCVGTSQGHLTEQLDSAQFSSMSYSPQESHLATASALPTPSSDTIPFHHPPSHDQISTSSSRPDILSPASYQSTSKDTSLSAGNVTTNSKTLANTTGKE